MQNKGRTILMTIVYIITAIAVLMGVFAVYNLVTVQKPWTMSVAYAGSLEYSEKNTSIVEIEIHSNENNNGQAIFEMQFSSYTDTDGSAVKGFGIQCVGNWNILHDYETVPSYKFTGGLLGSVLADIQNQDRTSLVNSNTNYKKQFETYAVGDFYLYYTGDDGETYYKLPDEKIPDYLLIDINGKFYKLTLKTYNYQTQEMWSGGEWFKNIWSAKQVNHNVKWSWYDVFGSIMNSAISHSEAYKNGKFALNLFDLSTYLNIEYKDDSGRYHPVEATSENQILLSMPVNYSKDGSLTTDDTKFKMVGYSTSWGYYNDTNTKDYWAAETPIVLDETDIKFSTYEEYDKDFITLDGAFVEYLHTLTDTVIDIKIDISKISGHDVIGIDLTKFDFPINSFEIVNAPDVFIVVNQSYCKVKPTITKAV